MPTITVRLSRTVETQETYTVDVADLDESVHCWLGEGLEIAQAGTDAFDAIAAVTDNLTPTSVEYLDIDDDEANFELLERSDTEYRWKISAPGDPDGVTITGTRMAAEMIAESFTGNSAEDGFTVITYTAQKVD
ncbi:UNVERIFIED_CONTAM: hypothetical protein IGO34_23605 [Salmonella enterica subsp. enterica serovar Weltevreden]